MFFPSPPPYLVPAHGNYVMLGYHYYEVDVCLLGFSFLVQVSLYLPIQFCVLFTLLHMSRISFCAKVNAFLYECIIYLAMSLFVILYFQIMVVCCNECPCQVLLLILEDSFKNIYLKELQRKGKTKKKKELFNLLVHWPNGYKRGFWSCT